MKKRSVGLQKGVSSIMEGISIPEAAGTQSADDPKSAGRDNSWRIRLDPIALFEQIAERNRPHVSVWSRLKRAFTPRQRKKR